MTLGYFYDYIETKNIFIINLKSFQSGLFCLKKSIIILENNKFENGF